MLFYLLILPTKPVNSVTYFAPSINQFKQYSIMTNIIPDFKRTTTDCIFFDTVVSNDVLRLCIIPVDIRKDRLFSRIQFYLPSLELNSRKEYDFNYFDINFVRGYVLGNPFTSSLSGFVSKGCLYGKIQIDKRTIYIEPLSKFKSISRRYRDLEGKAITYEANDINFTATLKGPQIETLEEFIEKGIGSKNTKKNNPKKGSTNSDNQEEPLYKKKLNEYKRYFIYFFQKKLNKNCFSSGYVTKVVFQ